MTRHKQSLQIYADKLNHPDSQALKRTLKRSITKDNVIDWPLDYAIRAGFNPDKLMGKVINHLAGVGNKVKKGFNYVADYEAYLLDKQQKSHYSNKTAFREAAKQMAGYLDKEQEVSKQYLQLVKIAKIKQVKLTELPEYHEFNNQAKAQDNAAYDLLAVHRGKLAELKAVPLNPKKVEQAAECHEQFVAKERYEILKTQNPILAQYDELLKQRKQAAGYYREKIDKKIHETINKLITDKRLMNKLKEISIKIEAQTCDRTRGHRYLE